MKTKITIFQKRSYDFKGQDGVQVTGNMFSCFDEFGNAFEFSTKKDHKVTPAAGYDPKLAQVIDLEARINDKGQARRREVV